MQLRARRLTRFIPTKPSPAPGGPADGSSLDAGPGPPAGAERAREGGGPAPRRPSPNSPHRRSPCRKPQAGGAAFPRRTVPGRDLRASPPRGLREPPDAAPRFLGSAPGLAAAKLRLPMGARGSSTSLITGQIRGPLPGAGQRGLTGVGGGKPASGRSRGAPGALPAAGRLDSFRGWLAGLLEREAGSPASPCAGAASEGALRRCGAHQALALD